MEYPESEVENEVCPMGYTIGANGITIAWDSAIAEQKWDSLKDTTIHVSMHTLIRNAMNAFADKTSMQTQLVERIEEDVLLLRQYFDDVHGAKLIIYYIDYTKCLISKLPNFRRPKTPLQIAKDKLTKATYDGVKHLVEKTFTTSMSGIEYIISHNLYDMAVASTGTKLIETHTGTIKSRSELNSKLNLNDTEYTIVPFTNLTYMLYGDKSLLNKNTAVTKKLMSVFLDAKVTPLSTESRAGMAIRNRDPLLYRHIKDIIK